MKVITVFGTRPEAIKMAPVVHKLKADPSIETIVCVTAQHRELLDQVLELFDIVPDYDANIMQKGQGIIDVTERVMRSMYEIIEKEKPDWVLVHGDTTTTFATSLAAFYNKVPVGHVEAGLRTGDLYSPWPEEANRKLTGALAALSFAPTSLSRDNLLKENVPAESVSVTGNTVVDALFYIRDKLAADAGLRGQLEAKFEKYKSKKNILVTCHRREIFGEGIKRICAAIAAIAKKYPDMSIIYPVHPNPNIYMVVQDMLAGIPNIKLIEPLSYTEFVYLMLDIDLIVTDSGGVQEESVSLGKATLVVRETTERPEALEFPLFKLVGTNTDNIIAEVVNYFDNQDNISDELQAILPFGKGNAADLILQSLKKYSGSLELDKNLVNA